MKTGSRLAKSVVGKFWFVCTIAGLGGCAGEGSAQQVAYQTLKALASYEIQLDRKIAAEKTYYQQQGETIRNRLGGVVVKGDGSLGLGAGDIKNTWLYGRIRTAAIYDARRTAGEIMAHNDSMSVSLITDYVSQGIEINRRAIQEARDEQQNLVRKVVLGLQPIEKQKGRLAALRSGLTTLAASPDAQARLSQVLGLASIALEELKKPDDNN